MPLLMPELLNAGGLGWQRKFEAIERAFQESRGIQVHQPESFCTGELRDCPREGLYPSDVLIPETNISK